VMTAPGIRHFSIPAPADFRVQPQPWVFDTHIGYEPRSVAKLVFKRSPRAWLAVGSPAAALHSAVFNQDHHRGQI